MNKTIKRPRKPQKSNPEVVDGRDLFQTPDYAVDLLVPFLKKLNPFMIWECAAGLGKIVKRLEYHGFNVFGTDIQGERSVNFLKSDVEPFDCIVTNTPFSLKQAFYRKCLEYSKPFALLIPAEYSQWIIDAVQNGCEKIIPTRRIDYITPHTLTRIHEGEVWKLAEKDPMNVFDSVEEARQTPYWMSMLLKNMGYHNYKSIYDVPAPLLRKYSSSYFHSMWLTKGFNLGQTETFVELTNEMKDNI